ncbi:recombination protein Rad52 [Annulohypoxylon truncatum]|uniref:recombination protein Rad52 n=1 Tax=Annulohypoxylon truncatum TaxID=327061 RepID=UPI002008160E|nr:recombination protein Rad52 [Annulohypoxylon truncatum]KAI1205111.1 recombination protein Rad52 [Annulohypoxylon truncatum]
MPAPGEQHNGIANPFEEARPHISEFTATQIATLQSRLEKQLGPEYLSARSGPSGQKVHYIAAEKCINLANEVFGFNGWSSSIQNIQVDFVDENPQTFKISLGLSVIIRVTLRDGTYHEDIGYGHIENCKGKAAAFEKAKKEGTTDALKRALRNFGNVLGNCIYDKDYLSKVTKMKVGPVKFDEDNLHRHSDFAKKTPDVVKVEPKEIMNKSAGPSAGAGAGTGTEKMTAHVSDLLDEDFGDFDMVDFGVTDEGHPDEVILPASHGTSSSEKSQTLPVGNSSDRNTSSTSTYTSANSAPKQMQPPPRPMAQPPRQPQTPNQQTPQRPGASFQGRPNPQQYPRPLSHANNAAQHAAANNRTNTPPPQPRAAPTEQVGFFSARSIKKLPESATPDAPIIPVQGAKPFDPHLDSPSIRKTPGIDHSSSKPLSKDGKHVPPTKRDPEPQRGPGPANGPVGNSFSNAVGLGPGRPSTSGVGNPALNQARQIGAPGGVGSPMGNRGQYRPLTVKRPAPTGGESGNRTPLTEVSTNGPQSIGGGGGETDPKRQKVS